MNRMTIKQILESPKNAKWIIGIDPGVKTGIAIWDRANKSFRAVTSGSIITAQNFIKNFIDHQDRNVLVRIEDARKRKWFGGADARQQRSGAGIREGVGSVKRDCQIWEEFCLHHNLPFELVAPKSNKTKLDAKLFSNYTGWKEKTNEHARDAGMLVYGF